jgi:hypothetical protein
LVENERPGGWYVDEKRVNPRVPFKPDAPPYDPDDRVGGATPLSP